jgi:hypothetical protein
MSGLVAAQCPGASDDLVLLDSTPVECGRSVETSRRSELADVCGYGYCKSHSRWFWGLRLHLHLHLLCAPDGTPRAASLVSADRPERDVALPLLARALIRGETIVCDKGYAGRGFEQAVSELGGLIVRPARKDEPQPGVHLAPIRQRIESVMVPETRSSATYDVTRPGVIAVLLVGRPRPHPWRLLAPTGTPTRSRRTRIDLADPA